VLESVLSNFPGTILLVSHDRYLIDSLASQIWEVEPRGQKLQVFKGSYTAFKAWQMKLQEQAAAKAAAEEEQSRTTSQTVKAAAPVPPRKALSKFQRKQIGARLEAIEREIRELEGQQETISTALAAPPADQDEVLRLGQDYVALQERVEALMVEWAQLEERLGEG
jgi:ATP-binding cassette subfamily F protein 3